ncbi:alcohol dehydrogenase GroES domain protein [Cyathus striatus]|nr:alcohol dehydrogenase GroES domain protein [Cyathus striatus]
MKAARYYGPGDVRVEDIPEPPTKNGHVKIKEPTTVCGSDLHAYLMKMWGFPTATEANYLTGETLQFSGTITELGEGVDTSKWHPGQRVCVEPVISCMEIKNCYSCASGSRNVCEHTGFIGISGWGGGLSEYIVTDVKYVHFLPDNISFEVGACIEPLAVAYHAVKHSKFKKGNSALVVGSGPIGLFLIKVLRSIDPDAKILVSEPASLRRELALKHGASQVIDPKETEDVPGVVRAATHGVGVDFAFDAAGIQVGLSTALQCIKVRGAYVNVAIWETNPVINMNYVLSKEIWLTGTLCYDRVHAELIQAVAEGKIPGIEELITSKIAIEDVVEKGFLALLNEKDKQVKILVHP